LEFTTIKGFKDILPEEADRWQHLETKARSIFRSFGFKEIKPPILEWTEVFSRGIGEDTDIVSKEMYTLRDSKGRGMTLRPEATAGVVRAYIQHRLYNTFPVQKLYAFGPMFLHERPQKGRFRQFHQIDAETFGDPGPRSDAEIIVMAMDLIKAVGLSDLTLHLNSLGCPKCRVTFKEKLKTFLLQKRSSLCEDCARRSETNPLRVFDCKVPSCNELVSGAPSILEFICGECEGHFQSLQGLLGSMNIPFVLNNKLVRGLDYYTRTTFEIQTERLGAQNAVVGGGRYDGLIRQLGGPDHPGIGFALGVERLIALLEEAGPPEEDRPDLFIAGLGDAAEKEVFNWVNALRRSGFWIEMEYAPKGLKAQMKRAGRLGARKVLIVGDNEIASGKGILRDMNSKEQRTIDLSNLVENMSNELHSPTNHE